jgi:hypothetical protein
VKHVEGIGDDERVPTYLTVICPVCIDKLEVRLAHCWSAFHVRLIMLSLMHWGRPRGYPAPEQNGIVTY